MEKGLVSVIIPCYNGERFLDKCLKSLLYQTYSKVEVIIVNDGSTDLTEKIIDDYVSKFRDKNKKLIKINQKNMGQASAINNALKSVNGEYLMWQDADDWYELNAIENLVNYLKENNEYDFVRGNAIYRDEKDISAIVDVKKSKYPDINNIFDFYVFEKDSYCFAGIFMIRMEYFDKCVDNRKIYESRAGQNWQIILPVAYNGKCGYLDIPIYNVRIVSNSHSHSVKKIADLILRCNQHQDILLNVVNNINMPLKAKRRYKIRIMLKYSKKKIRIMLAYIHNTLKGDSLNDNKENY